MRRLRRFFAFAPNWLALLLVGAFIMVAFVAPWLAPPEDPEHPSSSKLVEGCFASTPLAPSHEQLLGTVAYYVTGVTGPNVLHFDVFYSLVWGTREVLRFGLITALAAALLGVVIGAVSGYIGGVFKMLTMRLTDAFLAFPLIAGVWLFRTLMQTANLELVDYNNFAPVKVPGTPFQQLVLALDIDPVMLTLILFSWMPFARIISASVMVLKQAEYVQAAQVLGARPLRIIFRHLLPNAIAPAIVLLARDIGGMVIMQTAFAFIGVSGTVNSTAIPEWSRLLMLGRHWIIGQGGNPLTYWWLYIPVTLALIFFGIGWNLLGDGLNMVLNPRTRAHFTM